MFTKPLGWNNFWPLVQTLSCCQFETFCDKLSSLQIKEVKGDQPIGSRGAADKYAKYFI
jgi:hypothetical protein